MHSDFQTRLKAINASACQHLPQMARGLEKEGLRVTPTGHLSQQDHPHCLGSALTHHAITTDYSEALLEFITPVFTDIESPLKFLETYHRFSYQCLPDEKIWVTSMPCIMEGELNIPIAKYGDSNSGKMRSVYRHGLWHRYGRLMQTIAGVHYNVSLPQAFWKSYQQRLNDQQPLQDFISAQYFHIIRNFQRYEGLIAYLFGASPAVCPSFLVRRKYDPAILQQQPEQIPHTLFAPYGTSLRLSKLGYQNDAQSGLDISYNSLAEYVDSLTHAIRTNYEPYEKIGVKVEGQYRQLNTNVLQIENEYYGSIRPKRTTERGERPTVALAKRGVEYLELRCVDLNPFAPAGINAEQIRFLDCFVLYCLIQPSPTISAKEQACINHNHEAMVLQGRNPSLTLQCEGNKLLFRTWAKQLLQNILEIAELFDNTHHDSHHSNAVNIQLAKIEYPEKTPSGIMLDSMRERRQSIFQFSMEQTKIQETYYRQQPLTEHQLAELRQLAEQSHQQQQQIEASDTCSFEEYLARYFAD